MSSSGDGIRLRSSARTSVGQVRENNEDSVHLWSGDAYVLAVVADGMGGAAAGEEASQIAIEAIQAGMPLHRQNNQDPLEQLSDDYITEKLSKAIQDANISIIKRAVEDPGMHGMGTTVTLAFVRGNRVIVAHVGDSRAYRVRKDDASITQITSDHSFVEALLAAGHITPEQADDHPMRNVLYRALGQAEDVDVDIYSSALEIGDRLVLCSDGLTRHVKPPEIAEVALAEANPSLASKRLIELANERGGEDNVSVIVVAVESTSAKASDEAAASSASEENKDDTLVLKEASPLQESTDEAKAEDPPSKPPTHLSKQKMDAERISDQVQTEQPESLSFLRSNTAAPPDPITAPVPPGRKSSEGDGEGHDTRSPEQ